MSSAIVPRHGVPRRLDRPQEPDEQVTEEQVEDSKRLSRLLMRLLREVAILRREWRPSRVDFQDAIVDATGTTKYRFPHGLGSRVRWWVTDWTGAAGPQLSRDASSTDSTLVLVSYVAGTMTLRVEASG